MKMNVLPIQRRLRTLACATAAITIFVLPAGFAFARGHGGGAHFSGGRSASHGAVTHSGSGPSGIHSMGMSRGSFARSAPGGQFASSGRQNLTHERSIGSVRSNSGRQLALRNSQRFGNLSPRRRVFFDNHHHFFFSAFAFGYPYRYGYYPYYADVCNPYSPYYNPFYCQQLYYRGY